MLKNDRFSHFPENTTFVTPEWSCTTAGNNLHFIWCLSLLSFAMYYEFFLPSLIGIRSKFRTDEMQFFYLKLG